MSRRVPGVGGPALSRRAVLAGAGTLVALPWLASWRGAAAEEVLPPRRLLVVYMPNGMLLERWTPAEVGAGWTATELLQPLDRHRARLSVLSKLANVHPVEGEIHGVLAMGVLSGQTVHPWSAPDPATWRTMDRVAASHLAGDTLPALMLSGDGPSLCGEAVAGMFPSCSPYWTVSYDDGDTPILPDVQPRRVFDRLFAGAHPDETAAARAERLRRGRSVLDAVREDAARIQARISAEDHAKVEQYLTGVRELERRLEGSAVPREGACGLAVSDLELEPALDAPGDADTHAQLMRALVRLAFQCDRTRVVTWMLGNERSDRTFPQLGISESHHHISHHGGDVRLQDKVAAIMRWENALLADVLDDLAATPEADGTLLDHTVVLGLSGMSEPNSHDDSTLPVVLAGGEALGLQHGQHHVFDDETPLPRLHLTVLRALGLDLPRFAEATEELPGLRA